MMHHLILITLLMLLIPTTLVTHVQYKLTYYSISPLAVTEITTNLFIKITDSYMITYTKYTYNTGYISIILQGFKDIRLCSIPYSNYSTTVIVAPFRGNIFFLVLLQTKLNLELFCGA